MKIDELQKEANRLGYELVRFGSFCRTGQRKGAKTMIKIESKDVLNADLLAAEEANELPTWILANGDWWWLRSQGADNVSAANVLDDGGVDKLGSYVDIADCGVRPALKIANLPNLVTGDLVEVFGLPAQYIGNDSVLLCEPIGFHRFDAESNDYATSEVKRRLDGWFRDKKGEENG